MSELLPEAELFDELAVFLDVFAAHVFQKPLAATDELEEPAARMKILWILLEVRLEIVNARRDQRDLNAGRARVLLMGGKLADDVLLLLLRKCHSKTLQSLYFPTVVARLFISIPGCFQYPGLGRISGKTGRIFSLTPSLTANHAAELPVPCPARPGLGEGDQPIRSVEHCGELGARKQRFAAIQERVLDSARKELRLGLGNR